MKLHILNLVCLAFDQEISSALKCTAWKVIPDTSSRWEQRQSWDLVPIQTLRMCTPSGRSCLVRISPLSCVSCVAEDHNLSAVALLFVTLMSLHRMQDTMMCKASAEDHGRVLRCAAPEPIPQPNSLTIPHAGSYGRAHVTCISLPFC